MNEIQPRPNARPAVMIRKITTSGLVIAAYIVVMYFTQSISFGQYQMRLATSLYALSTIYPFLVFPLGMANLLSNLIFGGLGIFDIAGGFVVGILTASACLYIRKMALWLVGLPILIIPSLLVPVWLSVLLGVPYRALVISIGIGQTAPALMSVLLVKYLEAPLKKLHEAKR